MSGGRGDDSEGFEQPKRSICSTDYPVSCARAASGIFYKQESHGLPGRMIWATTVAISLGVSVANWVMAFAESQILVAKFSATFWVIELAGVPAGVATLVAISILLAALAAAVVFFLSPACAGSGLPEAKGYLNGNNVPEVFEVQGFLARFFGAIFAASAGFPTGREGPLVCIGGCIGIGAVHVLAKPYMQKWVEVSSNTQGGSITTLMLQEERYAHAKRVGCVLGGAAGIATVFNAPVGAILYMFEEVSVASWPSELTFRAFVCTALAAVVTRAVVGLSGESLRRLLIFESKTPGSTDWTWIDVPLMICLAAFIGVFSAFCSRAMVFVWTLRQKAVCAAPWIPFYRILESVMYAIVCSFIFGLVPLTAPCMDEEQGRSPYLTLVKYTCTEGYNEVATLLLSPHEASVRHLFSRSAEHFELESLGITLVAYTVLAIGMPGLAVPMGSFLPSLFIGALLGRLTGEACRDIGATGIAHAAVYSLVGGAAMLAGFTHMTIAIVVLIVESASDLSAVIPLMIGIFVSHLTSKCINHHSFDEELILRKGVPYLDVEPPRESADIVALDLCRRWSLETKANLKPEVSIGELVTTLKSDPKLVDFPVLQDDICVGLVTRTRLQEVALAYGAELDSKGLSCTKFSWQVFKQRLQGCQVSMSDLDIIGIDKTRDEETHMGMFIKRSASRIDQEKGLIPVHEFMDTIPHVIREDMPMSRFYHLFTSMRVSAACVISNAGRFRGVLSRENLILATRTASKLRERVAESPQGGPNEQDASRQDAGRSSQVANTQPRQHHLPGHIIWMITILIPLFVGATNYAMVLVDASLVGWKLEAAQTVIHKHGVALGALALMGISTVLALIAVMLVTLVAPICAGSGLPEAKGYLNGNYVKDMFEPMNFFVRVVGIVFSVAAGFPIGREGPMVCIGGCIGIGAVHILAGPYVQSAVQIGAVGGGNDMHETGDTREHTGSLTYFVETERFRHAKRIGCMLGGAAGIASAFGAPVGGILYMFEEVTATSWPSEVTFRIFICTVVACLVSQGLLNVTGRDVHRLILWSPNQTDAGEWQWVDLPVFVVLAVVAGSFSAIFTRGLVAAWKFRKWMSAKLRRQQPFAKIVEAMAYAAVCALVFALAPSVFHCMGPVVNQDHSSAGSDGHLLGYVVYNCGEQSGKYNEVATLLLSGAEGAVKHLFSRESNPMHLGPLLLSLGVYSVLGAGMAGLAVPMGAFVPSLLMGAMLGRMFGEVQPFSNTKAGIYAMVGSAAMLGAFTEMTIAIVVLLIEASRDLNQVVPLMLSIFISHVVSKLINHHGYDEQLIELKGIPYLETNVPHNMTGPEINAATVCPPTRVAALLPAVASVAEVQQALQEPDLHSFPVMDDDGMCIGLVTRQRLLDTLWSTIIGACCLGSDDGQGTNSVVSKALKLDLALRELEGEIAKGSFTIPLRQLMDPAPYFLLEQLPVARFYRLFTKVGANAACVVTRQGDFRGVLSRLDLIAAFKGHPRGRNSVLHPAHWQEGASLTLASSRASGVGSRTMSGSRMMLGGSGAGGRLQSKELNGIITKEGFDTIIPGDVPSYVNVSRPQHSEARRCWPDVLTLALDTTCAPFGRHRPTPGRHVPPRSEGNSHRV